MYKFLTLTNLRRVVQLFAFVFMVYGALLFNTFYSNDKLTTNLPALSCAYDKQSGDYCALIPLQHQFHHRVGGIFDGDIISSLMPTFLTLGGFIILIIILNKAFCGWMCPLGFFQEMITIIGKKLKIKQIKSLDRETLKKVRPIKWFIFAFLVLIFPFLAGLGFVGHELGNPYCNICPSRILTTLATGDISQLYVDKSNMTLMILSLIADFLFGLMIAMALFVRQPFCRICPMLPLQSVFKKVGLLRLVKNGSDKCSSCSNCAKECPMDIFEITNIESNKNITYTDCTLCGRCVEFCPHDDILKLKYGTFDIVSSSKEAFKKRNKIEKGIYK
ncbi:MAG: 4Fe-4S binding protein [Sulfurovum sp.]|nr:MAG: 4Fe-4S binding protein [Sulfurovum sp.]